MAEGRLPLWRQMLDNGKGNASIKERRTIIKDVLKLSKDNIGPSYCRLTRLLARLSFQEGDEEEGIFYLIESHAVVLRQKALTKYYRFTRDSHESQIIDKQCIEFSDKFNKEYSCVLQRLKEMPQEWTVVQISCDPDSVWRFGGPAVEKWTPKLHVLRLESGENGKKPLHMEVEPPLESRHFIVLNELNQFLEMSSTDHLCHDRKLFWETRRRIDEQLKNVVDFINDFWLVSIAPLLSGHLIDTKFAVRIRDTVDSMIFPDVCAYNSEIVSTEFSRQLLYKTAENIHVIDKKKLKYILAKALSHDRESDFVRKIAKRFDKIREQFSEKLQEARRHPVILILDEKLDALPLETLYSLVEHPVTRVPSLHFLYGLFSVHKRWIVNGLMTVNSDSGYIIINPGLDLRDMQERITNLVLPRIPNWTEIIGRQPKEEDFEEAVSRNDIFVYMGHGSGSQFWNVENISRGIKATSLLFGCKSAQKKSLPGCIEADGSLASFQAAACPSILGTLWNVTDKDTDLVAHALLDIWLPRQTQEREEIRKTKIKHCNDEDDRSKEMTEPELLRALNQGRKAARMFSNKLAFIVRGLPIILKLP